MVSHFLANVSQFLTFTWVIILLIINRLSPLSLLECPDFPPKFLAVIQRFFYLSRFSVLLTDFYVHFSYSLSYSKPLSLVMIFRYCHWFLFYYSLIFDYGSAICPTTCCLLFVILAGLFTGSTTLTLYII